LEQREILQSFQDFHDYFGGRRDDLPRTNMVCFSTVNWWTLGGRILPSLLGDHQRVSKTTLIPGIEKSGISALVYRYVGLYQIAGYRFPVLDGEQLGAIVDGTWAAVSTSSSYMRMIHRTVREQVRQQAAAVRNP